LRQPEYYNISPKYKDTQDEWVQALEDLHLVGISMLDILDPSNPSESNQDWTNLKK